jgi:hypothetical protein
MVPRDTLAYPDILTFILQGLVWSLIYLDFLEIPIFGTKPGGSANVMFPQPNQSFGKAHCIILQSRKHCELWG